MASTETASYAAAREPAGQEALLGEISARHIGLGPSSLASDSSGHSSLAPDDEAAGEGSACRCSAVHTLERDMPDFDYSQLVRELRRMFLEHAASNAGLYAASDLEKCRTDDWHLARFLLRHKLQLEAAYEMLCQAMRFNNESLSAHLRAHDFPAEFYQLGGIFGYEPDRKGNKMLYMRVSHHKRTPEIALIVQSFIYFQVRRLDEQAGGKGIALVFDCRHAGLANAELDTLLFIINTLKNYFPKGLSYLLIHGLPWILKPFWHLAKTMISDEHRQLVKFSDERTILEYVHSHNLPDFMGGTCARDYRQVPAGCTNIMQAAKLWGIPGQTLRQVVQKFEEHLPAESVAAVYRHCDELESSESAAQS